MTKQRQSRTALLAVAMLLSGAFLGLVISDNASADPYDVNGTVTGLNSDVSVTILNIETGYSEDTTTAEDGYYSFNGIASGNYLVRFAKSGYLSQVA
jgi:hypothetical protein